MELKSLMNFPLSELQLFECGKEKTIPQKIFHYTTKKYYLVHYVLDGEGRLTLNGKTYAIKKNTAFFFMPYSEPEYHPDMLNPWTYIWVGFFGDLADTFLQTVGVNENQPLYFDQNKILAPLFEKIYHLYSNYGHLELRATAAFIEIIGSVAEKHATQKTCLSKPERNYNAALAFINNNYQFKITINDIAKNVDVTPNYLSSLFKARIGMCPKKFLTDFRMTKAQKLLETGRFTVKQIAVLVGYDNQLHFSAEFKKYSGQSPLNYYKEYQKSHEQISYQS